MNQMQPFRYVMPNIRIYQGDDCLAYLDRELERLDVRRAVIVCGTSIADGPLIELTRSAVDDRLAGICNRAQAHSPLPAVEAVADQLRELGADAMIAIGGGSAIVTARAAAILLAEDKSARVLCTQQDAAGRLKSPRLTHKKIPQLVIPTTPTTAIVKAGSAVLDPMDGSRLALYDPKTRAHAVFLLPPAVMSAPRALVASAGLNTLTLAVEGLLSRSANPISDALLIHALRLLVSRLPDCALDDDLAVRTDLMWASILCGQGSDHTGAGVAIPLGHAICARYHVDNGVTDAIILPHVLRFNATAARPGIEKLAQVLGVPSSSPDLVEAVCAALESVFVALGVPRRLRDIGVDRDSFGDLAEVTMQDWFLQSNPRKVKDAGELVQCLEDAW